MARIVQAVGPSYQLADRKAAVQRSVNLYMQQIESTGEDRQVILRSCPGLTSYIQSGGAIRGSYNADGRWFVVVDAILYEVVDGALVERGTLATSIGAVSMAHGPYQLVVVDGANGYILTFFGSAFSQISSPGWLGSNDVAFLDGYFLFVDPDTEQFYVSAIDDATDIDALDFSTSDTQPDKILTHRVFKREAYFFGSRSIEVWINTGGTDFPLSRYNGTQIQAGIAGNRAVCVAADTLVFVGATERGQGYVYQLNGYQPNRISTQAVDEALSASGVTISECRLWSYHTDGAEFVGVEAPGMSTTWVWNAATGVWHEQARMVDGEWTALDVDNVTFADGEHYCSYSGTIYKIDTEAYTLGGEPLVRERTWPHLIGTSLETVAYRGLELKCTTGYGGEVTLEISNDGGFIWGSPLARSLGVTGRYNERIRWLALGSSNDRVFRLRCADAVPFSVYAATVET